MIKVKPNTLYFKDPETGGFKQLLAIKGNPGSISNVAEYFVSEAGDSEMLAMTQKGATAIKEELVENIADTKTELEEKLDKDIDDVVNNKTVATANYANYLYGGEATAAPSRPVWFSDSTYYDKKVYSRQFMYNPGTDTLMVGNITGKAAKADEATAVTGTEGTGSAPRHVWFSEANFPNQRAYTDKFKYNPYTDTLTVGNITGHAATADLSAKLSYKIINSIDELTSLVVGGFCYAIILNADVTINDLKFPKNARGMIVSNGTAIVTVVGDDGVTYTAFYDHNQKTWRGTRKSGTCITKLPHYTSPEMIENGGIYPPTANAVQASFLDIYWALGELSDRISKLEGGMYS